MIPPARSMHWWRRLAGRAAVGVAILVGVGACDLPFNIGQPSTRALDAGAGSSLDAADSFRVAGTYSESATRWTIEMEVVKPPSAIRKEVAGTRHIRLKGGGVDLEAIITTSDAYFRGQKFLAEHMGSDPLSLSVVKSVGNAWWKGSASNAPELADFTTGSAIKSTFLGSAATSRTDHVSVDGVAAVDLSGVRADVFIGETAPYRLLRIVTKPNATVDGITNVDLRYTDFNRDFGIAMPSDVVDFADLTTLPPIYSVRSVDTSGCSATCVVAALVTNLGGTHAAKAPSTVTFTVTDPGSSVVVGTCTATIQPDVGHNKTKTASCAISGLSGADHNAAVVTATAYNPGHA